MATAAAAQGGAYDAAVAASGPSMYWRLGEAVGAPVAVDSSGNGFDLAYTSTALLGTGSGIEDESDSSVAADGATAAAGKLFDAPRPDALEFWLRMTPGGDDGGGRTEIVYRAKMRGIFWLAEVDGDGVVRASMSTGDEAQHSLVGGDDHAVRMAGPATPVDDGFWHYVVVDFATGYVYVDLVQGPAPLVGVQAPATADAPSATAVDSVDTTATLDPSYYDDLMPVSATGVDSLGALGTAVDTVAAAPLLATVAPPQFVQLGTTYDGELDEFAVYSQSLSLETMAAHAAAGGLHWDIEETAGGEESAAAHCLERGLFWKGAATADGSANYRATGALNYITTTRQSNRCGAAAPTGKKPVFVSGQTVRLKLNGNTENFYVEFGPIQFLCRPDAAVRTCYGLFFNFKAPTANGVADGFGNVNDIFWQRFQDVPDTRISGCNPLGTHGWKLEHENHTWVAYFLCDVNTSNWVPFYRYNHDGNDNADRGWVDGWPDVEGFDQSYASRGCADRDNAPLRCWSYEGTMSATHFNFRYQNPGNAFSFDPVAYGVCRVDRSVKYDGRTTTATPPIAISIVKDPRAVVNDNCA